jgi:taurine dioxygenase
MYAAYAALPPGLRRRIEHLHAAHSFAEYYEALRDRDPTQPALTDSRRALYPDVVHPLARRNPRTGRKALYVNPGYATGIVELPGPAGQQLLRDLCDHCSREDFVYAHKWRNGDLLFWDNLAVNHKGTPFDTTRWVRRMHRTTVAGNGEIYRASLLRNTVFI